jgi:hypothetical protein
LGVEITPEEVHEYFKKYQQQIYRFFGVELEVAQIVVTQSLMPTAK